MINLSSIQFNHLATNVFGFFGKIDEEGILNEINGELLKSLELDSELLIGQPFSELLIWQTDDQNIKILQEALNKAKKGENSKISLKFRTEPKDVKLIDLNFVTNLSNNSEEIFFFVSDVSELHSELNLFKERCDQYLLAADIAEVGLWFWNLDTGEMETTDKCNEIFNLPEDEEISLEYVMNIIHPEDAEMFEERLNRSIENKTQVSVHYRVIYADGSINWLSTQGKTIYNEDLQAKTMVGSVKLINDSKASSQELEKIYKLEKKAKLEAEHANKTKDFFLALVSHELRTPLNSILGWTNILLKKKADEVTSLKALETIENSAKTQSKLIEDLVDSARVTSGKLKLELRPLNLYSILENISITHLPSMQEKNIEHVFNFDTKNVEVIGDTMRLRQVFSNLVGNAVKFTNDGGKIILEQKIVDDNVEVKIIDTGQGIAEEDFPFIFDRFAQGDGNYVKEKEGLGLGLSLAKILVANHQGIISAESEGIGHGSTFIVRLPLVSNDMQVIHQSEEPVKINNDNNLYKLKGANILIVEDNEDSRNVLSLYLSQLGINIESAESVSEAFKLLNSPDIPIPDLIISDIGMPVEDGYSFVKKLRDSNEYKDIPAVALSAFAAQDSKTKAFDAGFQIYHTKPFEPELLSKEIYDLLYANK